MSAKICYILGIGTVKNSFDFDMFEKVIGGKTLKWQHLSPFQADNKELSRWVYNKALFPLYKILGDFVGDITIGKNSDLYKIILEALYEQLPEEATTLCGHSEGSYLAYELAHYAYAKRGQKLDLVLMSNTAPFFNDRKIERPFESCRCLCIYMKYDPICMRMKPEPQTPEEIESGKYDWIEDKRLYTVPIPHLGYLLSKKCAKIIEKFIR